MSDRAVAVTGLGVVTPAGNTVEEYWNALCAARSMSKPLQRCEKKEGVVVDFGCEALAFDPTLRMTPKEARRTDRFAQFAVSAALDALEDAGRPEVDVDRAAVVVGNGGGGSETTQAQTRVYLEDGADQVSPLYVPMVMSNAAPAMVALHAGWRGPNYSIATACASGAHAIGEGLRMIRDGSADIVLAGGTEAGLTSQTLNAFARLQALSTRSGDPERASRPFDRDRDGFVMGEGAGFCVLERMDHARARGAEIHALFVGYGRNCDAHHLVMPEPNGLGAARCIELALADAELTTDDVVNVNAHGTSTRLNDLAEAHALHAVFGDDVPPVTSAKGVIGHLIGAAGAAEFVAACRTVSEKLVPPTANHENTDEKLGLDVVHGEPRSIGRGAVVSNSFGFGGHNAALVVVAP
jgi:3-oxoacyl-[acyl-carrier-protein] synthase II